MPWVRFEDGYLGSDKLKAMPTPAIALDMAGIIFSSRELRDGLLTLKDVQTVAAFVGVREWRRYAELLCSVNRWINRGRNGYEIHDYLEFQPSRDEVLAQREADRTRKREGRLRPAGRNGDVSGRIPAGLRSAPYPVPVPDVPNGTSSPPGAPLSRGARRRSHLSEQDRADLQGHVVVIGAAVP